MRRVIKHLPVVRQFRRAAMRISESILPAFWPPQAAEDVGSLPRKRIVIGAWDRYDAGWIPGAGRLARGVNHRVGWQCSESQGALYLPELEQGFRGCGIPRGSVRILRRTPSRRTTGSRSGSANLATEERGGRLLMMGDVIAVTLKLVPQQHIQETSLRGRQIIAPAVTVPD